jgi:DUF1009 family protein
VPSTLGIVAGAGDLPRAIAESALKDRREVFVLALHGYAEDWVERFQYERVKLGETGKAFRALKAAGCREVVLAGQVERPKFSAIRLDAKSVSLAPRVMAAALKGDDALLRSLVDLFEREGFCAVSVAEAAPGLLAEPGPLGRRKPTTEHLADIAAGFKIVRAMGGLDVGQAAIVCGAIALAVEAAEGTDEMIARIERLPEHIRGTPSKRRGVLVKAPKSIQDRKTDLPVIGVRTVAKAAEMGLAGIALEAGGVLILDRDVVAAQADAAGLFVVGVVP